MFNNIFDHIIEESIGSFIDVSEEDILAQESADVNTHFLAYNQSIRHGHGVIVIAHSQGNLFTNRVYNEFGIFNNIRKDAWMKQYISAIGVASPANNILGEKTPYMTFENDMIQLIPDSLPAIEPNPHKYYFENAVGEKIETLFSVEAHSFLTSYMEDNSTTKGKILEFINTQVIEHKDKRPSQWIKDQEFEKDTCNYKVTVKHQHDPSLEMAEKVYPFNLSKKLYQVNGEYVKASCGGENILEAWDGKKDSECLMIDNVEEEKIEQATIPNNILYYM